MKTPIRIGALVLLLLASMLSGCGYSKNESDTAGTTGAYYGPPPLTGDSLQELVAREYGEAALVRNAKLSGEGNNMAVAIDVDRPASVQNASVEGVMAAFSGKMLAALFEHPEVSSVTITMYGVTPGVRDDRAAVKIAVDRAAAREADWSMFGPMTMPGMASSYYIDPAILK